MQFHGELGQDVARDVPAGTLGDVFAEALARRVAVHFDLPKTRPLRVGQQAPISISAGFTYSRIHVFVSTH